MKIFSASQIRKWDEYTIQHEPVSSWELMERAAGACFDWICQQYPKTTAFNIFCGPGNNGGDGLAIARMLQNEEYKTKVYLWNPDKDVTHSDAYTKNLQQFKNISQNLQDIHSKDDFPELNNTIVIDALLGTGLSRKTTGNLAALIDHINQHSKQTISIDTPSGLFTDQTSLGNTIVKATETLSFQKTKLAFLIAENGVYTGRVTVMDIRLSSEFEQQEPSTLELTDRKIIHSIYHPRSLFSHKGTYGHACICAGSYGMMGAAVLSTRACLRSGVGKLTCVIPGAGYDIMQTSDPEAMCSVQGQKKITGLPHPEQYEAIGIGPGLGRHSSHGKWMEELLSQVTKPMVWDADALYVLSHNKDLHTKIPSGSILTPHPGEFERLFGKSPDDFARLELALKKAREWKMFIVLKGHHTFIATPEGKGFFNSTGNPGMASGGSGDVLTGILTGLLAQGYSPLETCLLGVYLHGLAGDLAASKLSQEALLAGDIVTYLGKAWQEISVY